MPPMVTTWILAFSSSVSPSVVVQHLGDDGAALRVTEDDDLLIRVGLVVQRSLQLRW